MTYEEALYHKLMLKAGFTYNYDIWLDKALEEENPLSDIVLDLSTAKSDNHTVSILNDYLSNALKIDYDPVFNYVWQDLHDIWFAGNIEKKAFLTIMHNIAVESGQTESEPWYAMYILHILYGDAENGHISMKSLDNIFEQFITNKITAIKRNNENHYKQKKHTTRLITACIIQLLYPFCLLTGKIFGYDFTLYPIITSILTMVLISPLMTGKVAIKSTSQRITQSILPFLIILNGFLFNFDFNIETKTIIISAIFIIISFIYSICKLISIQNKTSRKIITVVVSSILIITYIASTGSTLLFSEWGGKTTVKTIPSPDNTYIAEITDVDQGALGGDTAVYVSKTNNGLSVLIGKFTPEKELIYLGEWGESDTLQIEWKDENTLLINSEEYNIK